jgi:hypothetical protein
MIKKDNPRFLAVHYLPISAAARYTRKTWVCGHSLAGVAGSNAAWELGIYSVVSAVRCQIELSATG